MDQPFIPYRPDLTPFARTNRRSETRPEARLWYEVLARRQLLGCKFTRQKPLGSFIADFYCSELRLVIEVDGDDHAEKEIADAERTAILAGHGIAVIRISNQDVMHNLSGVYDVLVRSIEKRKRELGV